METDIINEFFVKEIIGVNKIKIKGSWTYRHSDGNEVIVRGVPSLTDQDHMYKEAKDRLSYLLLDQYILLKEAEFTDDSKKIIICDVLLNNVNISKYFPDFEPEKKNIFCKIIDYIFN